MLRAFLGLLELRGIQASGKTTFARSLLEQIPNAVRVNKDDLRMMLRGDNYSLRDEKVVKACEVACVRAAVNEGYHVIVDDTNLGPDPHVWRDFADSIGVEHRLREFRIGLAEAIQRDSLREKPVGVSAIRATARRQS